VADGHAARRRTTVEGVRDCVTLHMKSFRFAARGMPYIIAAALSTGALTGCSSSSKELRTTAQAAAFVSAVTSGEPYGDWKLASGASRQAQAWAARATLGDLGRKLRSGPPDPSTAGDASWTCEMARKLVSLGAVGEVSSFNSDDVGIVTRDAQQLGIKQSQISTMVHDASTVPFRDLAIATAVVCGPQVS
jgi:hypothetical protein